MNNEPKIIQLVRYLQISIGIVFLVFGFIKFLEGHSPAETIGSQTVQKLTFGLFNHKMAIYSLATFEVAIGLMMISNFQRKIGTAMALAHMICTFTPLIFYPELNFEGGLSYPTLLCQYILKNVVFIFALLIIYKIELPTFSLSKR